MTPYDEFKHDCHKEILAQGQDGELVSLSRAWVNAANMRKYSYHFEWLGRPIIQYPQDMIAMQEIIWEVKPSLIIETGIAHGGSLIFYASLLELISACGGGEGHVLGIDVEIRPHNRAAIEAHPMKKRISMIEGSSVDPNVVENVRQRALQLPSVLVCLDSSHTHEHVLAELEAYGPLVTTGSYCIVFDTIIEDLPEDSFPDRPWGKGNNPKTAVREYLRNHPEFEIDKTLQHKLLITVAPDGYLKRIT
jgi:cephalosporin hydroxylase